MKRLGRDAAELTALADHLFAHGLVLEMLAGPLAGMYDPSGHGKLLFAAYEQPVTSARHIWPALTALDDVGITGGVGAATDIAAGADGTVWHINSADEIYRYTGAQPS
ncbi:hypothetical protein [Streptomyces acidicola]|uniref:hypothetical protein n=1 Tax=Streptomyces acidicola TaxID=2596892 RepID=UPI003F4D91AF